MPCEPEHRRREAEQEHADAEGGRRGRRERDEHADDGEHRRPDHGVPFADARHEPSGREVAGQLADHEHGGDQSREGERCAAVRRHDGDDGDERALADREQQRRQERAGG